ncbi:MAG: four helix bundle protein [Ruminococcus sp.]|nr:four helix bundle protein [Ruminococcus sp.]
MSDSIMLDKAKDFAVDIVNLCRQISFEKKEYVLTKQLMRSGTSIGANIHESKYAQSKPDFVSKMQIALKECYESEFWLEIMNRTALLSTEQYRIYLSKCGALRRMLISSIKTTKSNIE